MEDNLREKTAKQFGKIMGKAAILEADVTYGLEDDSVKNIKEIRKELEILWQLFQESM